jgi:hypothetical protein
MAVPVTRSRRPTELVLLGLIGLLLTSCDLAEVTERSDPRVYVFGEVPNAASWYGAIAGGILLLILGLGVIVVLSDWMTRGRKRRAIDLVWTVGMVLFFGLAVVVVRRSVTVVAFELRPAERQLRCTWSLLGFRPRSVAVPYEQVAWFRVTRLRDRHGVEIHASDGEICSIDSTAFTPEQAARVSRWLEEELGLSRRR